MRFQWIIPALVATLLMTGAPSHAAEEGGKEDIKAQIRKQMEKIRELMKANEQALLELSTGAATQPKDVDVKVPDGSSGGSSSSGGDSSSSGSESGSSGSSGKGQAAGELGEDVARKIEELIKGQRSASEGIPGELERLIRMIPKQQGSSSSSGGDPKNKSQGEGSKNGEDQQAQARDARKQMSEAEKRKQAGKGEQDKPNGGKEGEDPNKRGKTAKDDKRGKEDLKRTDNVPAWVTSLPPEWRDAAKAGVWEKIPARYRNLLRRYSKEIQKAAGDR